MDDADLHSTELEHLHHMCEYFFLNKLPEGFVLVISFNDMEGIGERLAPIEDFSASDITGAEDSWYFVGCDHLFVLGWYFWTPQGDVEVSDN